VVEPHDLILDLGPDAGRDSTFLFLRGWIYPTDASINVALSQQTKLKTMMPSLEVRDARGQWRVAIRNLGFPSGKDKTIVIDLSGKFPTSDHITFAFARTCQIYWDGLRCGGSTGAEERIALPALGRSAARGIHARTARRSLRLVVRLRRREPGRGGDRSRGVHPVGNVTRSSTAPMTWRDRWHRATR
jgi:hypothetical protein